MRIPGWMIALLVARAVFAAPPPAETHWTDHARRFTGESARVRENAIKALKADPKLPEKLRAAYGTNDHFLALDVISTLRMRSLLPFLKDASIRDRTGFSYHVMNSLLVKKEYATYRELYLERLRHPKSSPAAKMALLDSLPRLGAKLSVDRLQELFRDPSPEVRSSVLSITRHEVLRGKRDEYLALLKPGMGDDAFQIRMQTLYLVSELPAEKRKSNEIVREVLEQCRKDAVVAVKTLCEGLGT